MERTERTQERTKPLFPPTFQALSKYYWRELLHLSSAVDPKAQRGVSDDYRKILQRDFAAIPRIHNQRPDVPYDVIQYLKDRDDYPELFKAPDGFYKGKGGDKKAPSFDEVFTQEDLIRMRQYYERLLKNNPDVMSVEQVAQFTGYNKNSVSRWCGKKELKCFYIKQRYQIPKEYLLDFLVSRYFIGIAVKSVKHQRFNEQIRKLRTGSDDTMA